MHFPITIGVRRSSFLALLVLLAHAAAALILFLPDWPLGLVAFITFVVLISAVISWRQCQPDVQAVRLLADGRLECLCRGEDQFAEAQLLPGATVHPLLTVMRLQCRQKTRSIVVLPDSASAEDRRRLRVWLRWRAGFAPHVDRVSELG